MMRRIRERERRVTISWWLGFDWADAPGGGFSFPCSEHGDVDLASLNDCARSNYRACLAGSISGRKLVPLGVQSYEHHYISPAIGLCDECGAEVVLDGFTCTCECGADYNMSGQRLAPREQWGEETGESLADILRIK